MQSSKWKWMWQKSNEKKVAKKRHARNFISGYVKIDEYHLTRTGLRGRKRWFFLCTVVLLTLVALGNLVLNILLLAALRFTPNGLPYMVFTSNNRVVFIQPLNSSTVRLMGDISGYYNSSLAIGSAASMILTASGVSNQTQVTLDSNSIKLHPLDSFSLYNRDSQRVFSVDRSRAVFSNILPFNSLNTTRVTTANIATESLSGDSVILSSLRTLSLQSQENINLESLTKIQLTSGNADGHFISEAREGLLLTGLPESPPADSYRSNAMQQLCICENGKLFRVLNSCSQANENINPCS